MDGSWKKATRLIKDGEPPSEADRHAWYLEVVERLKKADQYRVRSHAGSSEHGTPEGLAAGRAVLSPVSLAASSARTWKDDRPVKERGRTPVAIHRKKDTDAVDYPKSRDGSTKKKHQVEKTTVRPKSAEPVIPVAKSEHKSPKRTRPRAPKDLPVHGHGDLSGRKKAYKQSADKSSPVGGKPRAVPRPREDGGKVWLKPDSKEDKEGGEEAPKEEALVNGFGSEEHSEEHSVQPGMTGDDQPQINGEHVVPVTKPPMKVPLTTVKSPEEVTGVRSPDPESWTVPLEIGKGLHWMDGKTPDGVQAKGPPILLSKRLKESSLVGKSQKDIVVCDPGSENTGESVDL